MEVYHDRKYTNLVKDILSEHDSKDDRTGTGTMAVFSRELRFNLSGNTLPLLTSKKMHIPSIIYELLWYIKGDTNIKYLQDNGVRIWNEWADENGDLGPVYGKQWRSVPKYVWAHKYERSPGYYADAFKIEGDVDQLQDAIDTIRTNPDCRRIIVNAWNVGEIDQMALPPCHAFFQFYVANGKLSCKLTQRSCDVGLGVPFNIAQYSMLTLMIAHITGLKPGEFIWSGGDVHIYRNHFDKLLNQLNRRPYPSPTLWLNPDVKEIDDFKYEDIEIRDYKHHDAIKMEVSV